MVDNRAVPGLEEFEKEFNSIDMNPNNEIASGAYGTVFSIQSKKDG